ncbi:MBL fold metallo-hydrolase [Tardiphaga alba]|uniref:MBL fold metallo-hydrolase n=1 Tax=Tardiphaga alba TaxID=340268 RepID=A0ABX8A3A0_9BRAD|nr:MBL fold metallo-hydrolase [Tardiphaga alba]QUS38064.1 MBL fold metallo-hydrolase [Tardiphaga alba]
MSGVAAALCLMAALLPPFSRMVITSAQAAAGAVGGQAPGYYRMHVGRFEVTAMLDGTHPFQAEKLAVGAKPGQVNELLGEQALKSPFEGMINAFLVNTGGRLILIDAGAGNLYGKDGGGLVKAIQAAGYVPSQVDDVFITHLHEDHAGGLMLDGRAVFPNAVIHVSKRDADFWLDNRNQTQVGDLLKPFFPAIQKVVAPYIAENRFKPFEGDAELIPGLTPISAPGHTPGHTYYLLKDGVDAILFWGTQCTCSRCNFQIQKSRSSMIGMCQWRSLLGRMLLRSHQAMVGGLPALMFRFQVLVISARQLKGTGGFPQTTRSIVEGLVPNNGLHGPT